MPPIEQFAVATVGTLALAALAHRLGPYPDSLSATRARRRELLETGGLFALAFGTVGYAALVPRGLVTFDPVLLRVGGRPLDLVFTASVLTHVVAPLAVELRDGDRSLADLGFRWSANPFATVALVGLGIGVGTSAISAGGGLVRPPVALLAALYIPAFQEELLYRGVLQSKLERAVGEPRAWIASGVLFGIGHVPMNFLVGFGATAGVDPLTGVAQLATQIGFGLLFGVLYAKSRTLLAPVLAHYFANDLPDLVATVTASV